MFRSGGHRPIEKYFECYRKIYQLLNDVVISAALLSTNDFENEMQQLIAEQKKLMC